MDKTLNNTTANQAKEQISDLEIWGDGDTFKLICKASSKSQGWMKSTKAMEVSRCGVVVQVTTQQKNLDGTYSIAEALTFIPMACIEESKNEEGKVISRKIVF